MTSPEDRATQLVRYHDAVLRGDDGEAAQIALLARVIREAEGEVRAAENAACEVIARKHAEEARRREFNGGQVGKWIADDIAARLAAQ